MQERCTPDLIVEPYRDLGPVDLGRATRMYEEWMTKQWRAVAEAHAGQTLSEEDLLTSYGEWKDRHVEPGADLLRIICKDRKPEPPIE